MFQDLDCLITKHDCIKIFIPHLSNTKKQNKKYTRFFFILNWAKRFQKTFASFKQARKFAWQLFPDNKHSPMWPGITTKYLRLPWIFWFARWSCLFFITIQEPTLNIPWINTQYRSQLPTSFLRVFHTHVFSQFIGGRGVC